MCVSHSTYYAIFCFIITQKLPPVRNSLLKKKKKKVAKSKETADVDKEKKRIRGSDYRAWDKFDVVSCQICLLMSFAK